MQNGASSFVSRLHSSNQISKVIAVRGAAEVASIAAASLSSVVLGAALIRTPYEGVKDFVCRNVVEPRLESFEGAFGKLPSLDTAREREARANLSRSERAVMITNKIADVFGMKMILGAAGQFAMQEAGLRALNISGVSTRENALSIAGDKLVNLMGVYTLNRVIPDKAVEWQDSLKSVFLKAGLTDKAAQDNASYLINWQLPNIGGFIASIGLLKYFTKN